MTIDQEMKQKAEVPADDDPTLNTQKLEKIEADLYAEIEATFAEYELAEEGSDPDKTGDDQTEHVPLDQREHELKVTATPDPEEKPVEAEPVEDLKVTIEPDADVAGEPENVDKAPKPTPPPPQPNKRILKTNPGKRTIRQRLTTPKKSGNNIFAFAGLMLFGIVLVGIIFAMDDGEMGIRPPKFNGTPPPKPPAKRVRKSYRRKSPKFETGAQNAEALDELNGLTMGEYMRKHNLDKNEYLLRRKKAIAAYWEMRKRERREAADNE